MNQTAFAQIEAYMKDCMNDSAHDREHVYRVLYFAMDIAKTEGGVTRDVLIAACLMHDTGRAEQLQNPQLRHEQVGSRKALRFLLAMGWPEADAAHVADCIATHRFRSDNPPRSLEAKILFDADKLDAVGAMGIARTLQYKGTVSQPLYTLDAQGRVSDGDGDAQPSFFQEYKYKLEKLYGRFYTQRGAELAGGQRQAAAAFFRQPAFAGACLL